MTPAYIFFSAVYLVAALVLIALIAREAVSRLRAGPVRFRLGIASSFTYRGRRQMGKARQVVIVCAFIAYLAAVVLEIIFPPRDPKRFYGSGWIGLLFMSAVLYRTDAIRWLVFAWGLIILLTGAALLRAGLWIRQFADISVQWPRALMLVYSVIFFVIGAALLQESILGTIVRKHGIQMFCATVPWSRVVVKDWQAREGESALHLSILSPEGFFAMTLRPRGEIIVPVSASERPALEAFLAEHTATAG
jgi:hypothetical protein